MYLRATMAQTTNSNTPETDMMEKVMHTVQYTDPQGNFGTIEIMATDPINAMNIVNKMTVEDVRHAVRWTKKQDQI